MATSAILKTIILKITNFPLLSTSESTELHDALHYLKVEELKEVCKKLNVPIFGKKPDMINSIMTFLTSGAFAKPKTIPAVSKAKKGIEYPLEPQAPMMYGFKSFKNILKDMIGAT